MVLLPEAETLASTEAPSGQASTRYKDPSRYCEQCTATTAATGIN